MPMNFNIYYGDALTNYFFVTSNENP